MAAVARTIRVVNRRAVDRLAVLPDRELLGDGERLAVADDHADDVVVGRHPARDERVHAHARQADLAPGAVGMLERQRRQFLFVRAPAHLGRRRPFLAEALDAPGVEELVDLLGPIGDLRVALAAMDDLDAKLAGQVVELPRLRRGARSSPPGRRRTSDPPGRARRYPAGACLVKWLIRPGLAPCSSTAVGPGSVHDAIIRRSFMWRQ